jgi:cysteine desulfurase
MQQPIYLDYAATTPMDPRVTEKMLPFLSAETHFGNPASMSHHFGRTAKIAVETAREEVAELIHAEPSEIIWTSGATEAINLALKGAAQLYQRKGKHIVTMKTEHKAVLDSCEQLEKEGFSVTYLAPLSNGLLDLEKFKAALRPDTIAASIMYVNNETGVIQDLEALANITAEREILLHVDAAQATGKLQIDLTKTPIDLLAFCAHKIYGPKGVGALYVRRKPRVRVAPQIHGGGQEQGMRSGTLAPHQIVGMSTALNIAKNEMQKDYQHLHALRARFLEKISSLKNLSYNGDIDHCYPGILNVGFAGMKSEDFMHYLPELAVSAGSACQSKGIEPSHVLRAMGLTAEQAHTGIRFSFGRFTTTENIDYAAEKILAMLNERL